MIENVLSKLEFLMYTLNSLVIAPHHFPYKYAIGFSMLVDFVMVFGKKVEDISLYMDNILV
jgi:hypothetical protein